MFIGCTAIVLRNINATLLVCLKYSFSQGCQGLFNEIVLLEKHVIFFEIHNYFREGLARCLTL